ncbi:glycine betaine uptake BCCT transporter [Oceanobacillus polygoni]|uniref:Glycine betaine transporter n=1 Tax=Oceanobacillus polygoni TaxID=1235259 RepID=A0A9X0YTU7_9BACI|nr:BCCT family transporter [Oceanobacillus polygoni]MBP2077069.1 glycine betaine transporter [Oceanobacillus polygoni]
MRKVTIVFKISVVIAVLFVVWGVFAPESLAFVTSMIQGFLQTQFGWFYLLSTSIFLILAIYLIFSRYGNIKLGKDNEEPEYNIISWFAMLFSAGMGIGLVFWGVAEPVSHYMNPPIGDGGTDTSASLALQYSIFHWGLHPWGVFTIIALPLAYFKFRKDAPGTISATFYPLIGERVNGPIGKTIDITAVFATIFGVATSLGLGAIQINGGLSHLNNNIPNTISVQFIIIAVVTVLFVTSAISGINRGIQYLSNTNVIIAVLLMLFLLFTGPTNFILNLFTTTLGSYVQNLPEMSLDLSPFNNEGNSWVQGWTIFYWGWWIAWAPFVGMFIARVSRGRTIREFIIGVLAVPTIFSALWMSILGGSGIYLERFMNVNLSQAIEQNGYEVALFSMLSYFPWSTFLSVIAIILIGTFFITSADSATFVLGMQTTNGALNPPNTIKVTWGVIQSAIAAILLWSGGLGALQMASIIAAFPFIFIIIFMAISLTKSLKEEKHESIKEKNIQKRKNKAI